MSSGLWDFVIVARADQGVERPPMNLGVEVYAGYCLRALSAALPLSHHFLLYLWVVNVQITFFSHPYQLNSSLFLTMRDTG